ncbi:MAG: LON peptidase substrate-binding domain-containing protein [Gammaproteobacteria bacterium]|nr:LON peptidase substrate-binding domain-containing protein [Gammaproteobacteria bacterium]
MKRLFGNNHLPLFPLNSVIFVDGVLRLQIFEQRYLNLVKTCMKNQHGFITALISNGKEVDDTPETYAIGTYVEIIDWDTLENNLLGITIQGRQRVHINKTHVHDDNLISAEFNYLDNLVADETDVIDKDLLSLLHALQKHPFVAAKYPDINDASTLDIAYKLCELLPASNHEKQKLLEAEQTYLLLDQLKTIIAKLENLSPDTDLL